MDYLPLASITADRAVRRHFDGGRVESVRTPPRRGSRATDGSAVALAWTSRATTAVRAGVAGVLYRGARAVEPCGYRRPATR